MKQLLSLLRRHGRVVAGAAVILLASGIAFALRSAGPAHAQPAAAASSAASASVASAASAAGPTAAATNQGPARPVALVRSRSRSGSSLSRRGPALAPTEAPNRPGPAAQPASSRSVALSLRQATGLSISQVSARDVCPPVGAGQARCAAKALVLRSTGAPVHPPAGAGAALGRVRTTAAPATVPPAAATPPVADTPAYLQQAYDLSYLSQNAGHGDTVAVVDAYDDPSAESDLAIYRSTYGLPACTTANGCFRKVNQSGAASPLPTADSGWDQEITLDLDAVSAICPNCHILLVEANSSYFSDLAPAMQTAASLGANQISASWSGTSSSPLSGTYTFTGIPTVAATGDDGYVGPGYDSYPAALPNVTAAGGTSLATASGSGVRGFSESAWSGAGSGCDTQFATPPYQPSTSCGHRAYADVSADADPATGLRIYENNSWYLVGGTSLSTPLIASYYAITGVTTSTSQWAYSDSSLLNDIVSGTNGSCAAGISSICNAGVGFDGPTGVGSISGAVATGAPGIGASNAQSVGAQNATIAGGIYRNGLDTTWSIQYGPTNSYGSQTTPVDIGAGSAAMAVTQSLSGLAASTTYHYRLVATNALGTNYGYDYTFTTAASSAPSAAFAVTPTAPTPSSPVTFDATASTPGAGNTMTAYSWNFGDGASASTQTASHSYAAAGTYTVTLTVTNSAARSSTTTQTITVDNPPTASFTPSGTFAAPGASLSFNAGASTAGTGSTINDYSWNFGDGSVQDTGATASAAHTYTAPGSYIVKLTVTDNFNVSNTTTTVITVDQPTAAFTPPANPVPNAVLTFDGSTSRDPQGTITDYSWNFGDGNTVDSATNASVSHTYATRGTYTVTLTITNNRGQTSTATHSLTVDAAPTAAFTPSATIAAPGTAISFDGSASAAASGGSIRSYSWHFGDASTASTQTFSHAYTAPGTYSVTLTVTDDLGVSATSAPQQVVVDQPTAAFTAPSGAVAPNALASFFASTSSDPQGTIADYSWNFGDQGPSVNFDAGGVNSVSHGYVARGTYTVALTVTNSHGQKATTSHPVTVDTPPSPAFTSSASTTTAGGSISFDASGSSAATGGHIVDYSWSFSDGTVQDAGTSAATSHPFASAGTVTVTLTTTDDLGVSASTSQQVTVLAPPTPVPPTPAPPTPAPPVASPAPSAPTPAAPAPAPAPSATPAPAPSAPAPLNGSLSTIGQQRLSTLLAHGLRLSLSASAFTKVSFQISVPRNETKGVRGKASQVVLLHTRAQTLTAGTHGITLKLPRSATRRLVTTRPLALTVRVTLTATGGKTITRTVKIRLAR